MINFMNISAIKNQRQSFINNRYKDIYNHEKAHKMAGGALTGSIIIEKNAQGIPIGGHVSIKMPKLNPKNPKTTIDNANTVISSALAPKDPSSQDFRVASQARDIKAQAERLQNKKKVDYYA